MYIHKYIVGPDTVYRVTDEATKPSTVTLKQTDWVGRVVGKGKGERAVNFLESIFKLKPKEEEPSEKKAVVSNVLRNFAELMG